MSLLPAACLGAPAAKVITVPYMTDSTGAYAGDLYLPPTAGPYPAIVAIHGGSWRSGHKGELRHLCADLASRGFACFSIDYDTHRRSFPASWMESRSAVQFLREHATTYRLEPDRVAVLGTSAGGQLAALLALAPEGPAPASVQANVDPIAGQSVAAAVDVPVQSAVLFNGGYDLHPHHWLLRRYLGGECADIAAICNDASPDFHVHPDAPPIFVGHGTHDRLIPYSQATTFVDLLHKANDPVTAFVAQGAGHSYWRSHTWYRRNLDAAVMFLQHADPTASAQPAQVKGKQQP